MHIVPTHIDTERAARGWEAASTGESLLPASDIPLWQHRAKPRMDRMAGPLSIRYSRARREGWDRRGVVVVGGGGTPWCVFGLTFPLTWKAGMEREEAVLKTALL